METPTDVLLSSVLKNLAAQKNYNNLNMTMSEAIASRACCVEGVLKCYPHETLETIIDRIAKAEVRHARCRRRIISSAASLIDSRSLSAVMESIVNGLY